MMHDTLADLLDDPRRALYRDAVRTQKQHVAVELASASLFIFLVLTTVACSLAALASPGFASILVWAAAACGSTALVLDVVSPDMEARMAVRARVAHDRFTASLRTIGSAS